jgi:hypothetical protein
MKKLVRAKKRWERENIGVVGKSWKERKERIRPISGKDRTNVCGVIHDRLSQTTRTLDYSGSWTHLGLLNLCITIRRDTARLQIRKSKL